MARAARLTVTPPSPALSRPADAAAKPAKKLSPSSKPTAVTAAVPKLSKDELHAQVEALEGTVATLKGKAKVMRAAVRQVGARMTELEAEVTRLEGALSVRHPQRLPVSPPFARASSRRASAIRATACRRVWRSRSLSRSTRKRRPLWRAGRRSCPASSVCCRQRTTMADRTTETPRCHCVPGSPAPA